MTRLPPDPDTPRTVDTAFAALLQRLDPCTDPRVLHAARHAMFAVSQGHAALDLRDPALLADAGNDPDALRAALRASPWVDEPAADIDTAAPAETPLVLSGELLYLRRYYEYERRLALGLHRIAASPVIAQNSLSPGQGEEARGEEESARRRTQRSGSAEEPAPSASGTISELASLFTQLFPNANAGDDQARAAALALLRKLLLITGGPGTGKTTTLARLLVLLIAQRRVLGEMPPRIALAAPTGRAAERMAQSLVHARAALHAAGIDPELLEALPTQARTLHRLLGPIPDRPRFRHDAAHPLAYDVVVVDEASMVDLPLMCKLVEAVPDGAALILVGDPDQLPSVEAGDVLASIVHAAGEGDALPPDVEAALAPLLHTTPPRRHAPTRRHPRESGDPWTLPLFAADTQPPAAPNSTPLTGYRIHLRRGWRQSEALDLAPLAEAVRTGDSERALALLQAQTLRGIHFHDGLNDPLAAPVREQLLAPWRALADADDPRTALDQATHIRLLTAVRGGPQGAVQLNARIEEALAGARRDRYFHGRLLLITENSYRHGLFNGDIGICLRDESGAVVAWFASGTDPEASKEQAVRGFHPGTLPAHEGAFAMTVHKAQGSEFDAVWLLLPARENRVLSRELVYTAITRARQALHVAGSAEIIETALARHVGRSSGLRQRLGWVEVNPAM